MIKIQQNSRLEIKPYLKKSIIKRSIIIIFIIFAVEFEIYLLQKLIRFKFSRLIRFKFFKKISPFFYDNIKLFALVFFSILLQN